MDGESEELGVQGHPRYAARFRPDWDTWNLLQNKIKHKTKNLTILHFLSMSCKIGSTMRPAELQGKRCLKSFQIYKNAFLAHALLFCRVVTTAHVQYCNVWKQGSFPYFYQEARPLSLALPHNNAHVLTVISVYISDFASGLSRCSWECRFYMDMYYLVVAIPWERFTSLMDKESSERRSRQNGLCINDGPLPSSFRLFVKYVGREVQWTR